MIAPPFDIQGSPWIAAARDVSVTCLLSAFGTVVFRNIVAPSALARAHADTVHLLVRRLRLVAQASTLLCIAAMIGWLFVQSADFAGADTLADMADAVPKVLLTTSFGHVLAAQLAALLVLSLVLGWRHSAAPRPRAALAVSTLAVCLQAGHSHAASMYQGPSLLLACDVVHLLGAGAWLGGLVPLLLVVQGAPPRIGATAARSFSLLGKACVGALLLTAGVQGWILVASIPGLVGTAYGWMVLVKLALFAVLLGFAAANRYRFAPALVRGQPEPARRVLIGSLVLQTGAGIAIVIAAIVLSELPPAMHLQALWPFMQRFSLDAMREDPDFRADVLEAGLAVAVGLVLLAVALSMRRFRLAACGVLAVIAWFAVPQFGVLLADATPTSFYHSPTGFSSEAIVQGSALYDRNCVACHGASGVGDGPLAKTLPEPPADLTAAHLWMHSDGELFWWLAQGIRSPEGLQAMPGFADRLDDDQRWALIDYIRAHNAGTAFHQTGHWPHVVQAPALTASCGAANMQLADFRGRFVRLVMARVPPAQMHRADAATIVASPDAPSQAGICTTGDENVQRAYAIVSGTAAASGTQFLIDDQGYLRAVQLPGSPGGWDEPGMLQAEITNLRDHPVTADAGGADQMGMMNMKM